MNIKQSYRIKYCKYILWVASLCTQIVIGYLTQASPEVLIIALLGGVSAITSAEGWYSSHIIFIAYAIGAAAIAIPERLYGDVAAMVISAAGSLVALFTWKHKLRRHTVRTRRLNQSQWKVIVVGGVVICAFLCIIMMALQSNQPSLNAIILTMIILAEILFAQRYCETYTLECIGDITLTIVWILSDNWSLAFACFLDTAFAVYGLKSWRKLSVRKDNI